MGKGWTTLFLCQVTIENINAGTKQKWATCYHMQKSNKLFLE